MPVSVVEIFLGSITLACLNHLSDCDNLIDFPSADLSPNFAKASNCSLNAALLTGGAVVLSASAFSSSFDMTANQISRNLDQYSLQNSTFQNLEPHYKVFSFLPCSTSLVSFSFDGSSDMFVVSNVVDLEVCYEDKREIV